MTLVIVTAIGFLLILVISSTVFYVLKGVFQFLLVTPIYKNIFTIYAIANIHGVIWGNRASDLIKQERKLIKKMKNLGLAGLYFGRL